MGYDGQTGEVVFSKSSNQVADARASGIKAFRKKFHDKTANDFERRKDFTPYYGKYTLLDGTRTRQNGPAKSLVETKDSELSKELQTFLELISDEDFFDQELTELGVDNSSGEALIDEARIDLAFEILKQMHVELTNAGGGTVSLETLERLTGQLFTYIPHNLGFKKVKDFCVNSFQRLQEEYEILKRLKAAVSNQKLIQGDPLKSVGSEKPRHPLDVLYDRLSCHLKLLDQDHPMHTLLTHSIAADTINVNQPANSSSSSSSSSSASLKKFSQLASGGSVPVMQKSQLQCSVKIEHVFALSEKEKTRNSMGNRQLLWRGARVKDWTGILAGGT